MRLYHVFGGKGDGSRGSASTSLIGLERWERKGIRGSR
jgi:hypothetical protein